MMLLKFTTVDNIEVYINVNQILTIHYSEHGKMWLVDVGQNKLWAVKELPQLIKDSL